MSSINQVLVREIKMGVGVRSTRAEAASPRRQGPQPRLREDPHLIHECDVDTALRLAATALSG